jgi:hypothetical protein
VPGFENLIVTDEVWSEVAMIALGGIPLTLSIARRIGESSSENVD